MKHFIDGVLTPVLLSLGEWSLRWGVLLLVLLSVLALCQLRRTTTRHLLCRIALLTGLLLPLIPHWGPGFAMSVKNEPTTVPITRSETGQVEPKAIEKVAVMNQRHDIVAEQVTVVSVAPIEAPPVEEPLGLRRIAILCIAISWFCGVLLLAVRRLFGMIALERLRRAATPVQVTSAQLLIECTKELGLKRRVTLASHSSIQSPLVLGPWNPTILVPADWAEQPQLVQRACLLHELNHLARHDDRWALLYEFVRSLFFFHPLVLWLLGRLEIERELLCDEAAVSRGIEPRDYVRMLLLFARRPARLSLSRPLAWGKRRTVKVRIHHLLEENMNKRIMPLSRTRALALGLFVLTLAIMAGSMRVQADGEKPSVKSEEKAAPIKEPASPAVDRALLRYGGLSFEGWKLELITELKPEKRAEGVKALIAFGANGYGAEAAKEIFEMMQKVDLSDTDQQKLWEAGLDILRIGPTAVPIVTEALGSKEPTIRRYAAGVLLRFKPEQLTVATLADVKAAIPTWLHLVSEKDDVKNRVFNALVVLDPKNPDLLIALVQSLQSTDMAIVRNSIKLIGTMKPLPDAKKVIPALIRILEDDRPELNQIGSYSESIIQVMRENDKSDYRDPRRASMALLCNYGPESKIALASLIKLLSKYNKPEVPRVATNSDEKRKLQPIFDMRSLIVVTLGRIGPDAREVLPALREMIPADPRPIEPSLEELRTAIKLIEGK